MNNQRQTALDSAYKEIKVYRDALWEISAGTLDNETSEQFHERARKIAKDALDWGIE